MLSITEKIADRTAEILDEQGFEHTNDFDRLEFLARAICMKASKEIKTEEAWEGFVETGAQRLAERIQERA